MLVDSHSWKSELLYLLRIKAMTLHDVDDLGKGLVLCDMKVDNAPFVRFPMFVMQGRCLGLPGSPERVGGVDVACCRNIQGLAFWKRANNTWVEYSSSELGIEEGIPVNRIQLIHFVTRGRCVDAETVRLGEHRSCLNNRGTLSL